MDELDLLKKDWGNPNTDYKKLSFKDIYPMLHKKSSSIVKTLFYISIGELVLWLLINSIPYLYSDDYRAKLDAIYSNEYIFTGLTIFSYGIILLFIYLLFKAHKSISVTDSAKKLLESILRTRKIIKYYVLYNLVMAGISLLIGFYFAFNHDPKAMKTIEHLDNNGIIILTVFITVFIAVFILIIWLFYRLIYGLLLKRLNRNYKELKKLDV